MSQISVIAKDLGKKKKKKTVYRNADCTFDFSDGAIHAAVRECRIYGRLLHRVPPTKSCIIFASR